MTNSITALVSEIDRLRPHYQSSTATDAGRRQMLDHFDKFAADALSSLAKPVQPDGMPEVETVARTLCTAQGNNPDFDYDPNGVNDPPGVNLCWKLYLDQATAILALFSEAFAAREALAEKE